MFRRLAPLVVVLAGLFAGISEAEAQYKNGQFGFEGGYFYLGKDSGLDEHGFLLGMRGAYKGTDHWWFSARTGVGFRGEQSTLSNNTVVVFHVMPVDVRYYFLTDTFRPFVAVGSSFNLLFNQTIEASVFWGPQVSVGAEFRLKRDLFFGVQFDGGYNFVFEGPDHFMSTATAQLLFFL